MKIFYRVKMDHHKMSWIPLFHMRYDLTCYRKLHFSGKSRYYNQYHRDTDSQYTSQHFYRKTSLQLFLQWSARSQKLTLVTFLTLKITNLKHWRKSEGEGRTFEFNLGEFGECHKTCTVVWQCAQHELINSPPVVDLDTGANALIISFLNPV